MTVTFAPWTTPTSLGFIAYPRPIPTRPASGPGECAGSLLNINYLQPFLATRFTAKAKTPLRSTAAPEPFPAPASSLTCGDRLDGLLVNSISGDVSCIRHASD